MKKKSENQEIKKKRKKSKKKWIVIAAIVIIYVAVTRENSTPIISSVDPVTPATDSTTPVSEPEANNTVESEVIEESTVTQESESSTEPAANSSAKVDSLAFAAKEDVQENGVSDEQRDEAVAFIVEHYPDFYTDNETMEQAISYGYWLEYAYQDNDSARDYAELGMDLEQAVKYVYRGAEKVEDNATQENLDQIRESLEAIGQSIIQETESSTEPPANTSAKVDSLAFAARRDVQENGFTDEQRDAAVDFIVEHYPDFYTDNETMEQAISYGFWLEYAYQDSALTRIYAELGMDLEQAVKYVYRGAEKVEDTATQENLDQIRESLEAIGRSVE